MKQLARSYAQFVRGVLELPNARYTAQERPSYVAMVLSLPFWLLLMGCFTLWRQSEPVPPDASSAALLVVTIIAYGPGFALHYWLIFHNRYVHTLVLPNNQNHPRRVRLQLLGLLVSSFLLFMLMTSWHRLFPT